MQRTTYGLNTIAMNIQVGQQSVLTYKADPMPSNVTGVTKRFHQTHCSFCVKGRSLRNLDVITHLHFTVLFVFWHNRTSCEIIVLTLVNVYSWRKNKSPLP